MDEILFPEAVAQERIWGGTELARRFGILCRCSRPGEIIAAAGFPGHDTPLRGRNETLAQYYAANPAFFGLSRPVFPLAVNLIDAAENLSVQVHPTEEYARAHENCCGLPEAWVVLEAREGARLTAGHHARSMEQFAQAARAGEWDRLLAVQSVEKGDCFTLPPGAVHAVGGGLQVYEVTHAADAVYRLYDYGRLDTATGLPRQLHLEKALDVIYAPQKIEKRRGTVLRNDPEIRVEQLVDQRGLYTLMKIEILDVTSYAQEAFGIYTVVEGTGAVNEHPLRQGDTFIVPCGGFSLRFSGKLICYMATYRE